MDKFQKLLRKSMTIPSDSFLDGWSYSHGSGFIYLDVVVPGKIADFSTINQGRISMARYIESKDLIKLTIILEPDHPKYLESIHQIQFDHLNDAVIALRSYEKTMYIVRSPEKGSKAFMITDTKAKEQHDKIMVTVDPVNSKVEIHDGLLN